VSVPNSGSTEKTLDEFNPAGFERVFAKIATRPPSEE
jgi:hypothetical protein